MAFIQTGRGGGALNVDLKAIKARGYIKKSLSDTIDREFDNGMRLISPNDKVEIGLAVAELPVLDESNPSSNILSSMESRLNAQESENQYLKQQLVEIRAKQGGQQNE